MQMPSFRLPSLSLGDRFEDFPVRTVALYGAYTLVLFLVFLILNFPYGVLVDSLLNDVDLSPAQVSHRGAKLTVTRGLELRGVTVRRPDWTRVPIFEVPRAFLWPGISGLMGGDLTRADIRGDLYAGELRARWSGGDDLQRTILQVENVQVARYPPLRELFVEGQIFGLLSGFVEIEGRAGDVGTMRANGEIFLDQAGSEGLVYDGLPILDLSFVETSAMFNVQSGRIEIEELTATGPDVNISATGQIGIRGSALDSVLDLKVTIQAADGARPEVKGLVSLIPRQRGARSDAPLSITGTLRKPRFR